MFKLPYKDDAANIPRTVRFPEKMFEELNQLAQNHNLSFNTLILYCCKYALKNLYNESDTTMDNKK